MPYQKDRVHSTDEYHKINSSFLIRKFRVIRGFIHLSNKTYNF